MELFSRSSSQVYGYTFLSIFISLSWWPWQTRQKHSYRSGSCSRRYSKFWLAGPKCSEDLLFLLEGCDSYIIKIFKVSNEASLLLKLWLAATAWASTSCLKKMHTFANKTNCLRDNLVFWENNSTPNSYFLKRYSHSTSNWSPLTSTVVNSTRNLRDRMLRCRKKWVFTSSK